MNDSPVLRNSRPVTERYDTHVVNSWVEENRFLSLLPDYPELPFFGQAREILPDPFWTDHAAVVACYWRAGELAFSNFKQTTFGKDFLANYFDTAFNRNPFMLDLTFITRFGGYWGG